MCLPRFLKTHLLYIARVVSVLLEGQSKNTRMWKAACLTFVHLVGVHLVTMTTNMAKERNRRCTAETAETAFSL